jgi:uncharacterized protein (DUF1697 family)
MTVFIALLRGINVGGNNMIKMADLKRMFESIGLARVETYIQSGNVIFESNEIEDTLRKNIGDGLEKTLRISSPVILRTAGELERLIQDCPFSGEEITKAESSNSEGESFYVSLLTQAPAQEKVGLLNAYRNEDDEYRIINRDIYLLFRHSIRNSKLANSLQKLDVPGTVRNWKTINKLQALAKLRIDSR